MPDLTSLAASLGALLKDEGRRWQSLSQQQEA